MIERGFGKKGDSLEEMLVLNGIANAVIPKTRQIHSSIVKHVTQSLGDVVLEADAFVATDPRLVCAVRTADCVPLLLWDTRARVVAAVHAGWRGVASQITAETVNLMRDLVPSAELRVAMGPAMGALCYEVGGEVVEACAKTVADIAPFLKATSAGRHAIDLKGILFEQLGRLGILPHCIESDLTCTHCNTEYASYRRGDRELRQWSWIVIS